jgi:hypothetical protein
MKLLTASVFLAITLVSLNAMPRRQALIIGNDSYPGNALKNARNDANAIAAALASLGYVTMIKTDANRKALEESVQNFADGLKPRDIAFVYYSGHGLQVDGENYLLPVDFKANSSLDAKYQGLSLSTILDRLAGHGATTQVVILDACRDNPFVQSRSLGGRGWASTATSAGTFLAFGTSPGATASDNPGQEHGLFTQSLLKYLTSSQLDIEQMFEKVREDVIRESHGLQVPWVASSLIGSLHTLPELDAVSATIVPDFAVPSRGLMPAARSALLESTTTKQGNLAQFPPDNGFVISPERDANSVRILVHEGLLLAEQQNYDEAVRSLSAALAIEPHASVALRVLGLIFHLMGRSADGLKELDEAIATNPADWKAYYYRCLIASSSDPLAATRDCEAALGLQPGFAPAHFAIANALLSLGQTNQAYSEANEAVRLDPESNLGYAMRGKVATVMGKYSEAQRDFQTAIRSSQQAIATQ